MYSCSVLNYDKNILRNGDDILEIILISVEATVEDIVMIKMKRMILIPVMKMMVRMIIIYIMIAIIIVILEK